MAIHSSILACKIPWTDKLGGLQSMQSQRVKHDRACMQIVIYFVIVQLLSMSDSF